MTARVVAAVRSRLRSPRENSHEGALEGSAWSAEQAGEALITGLVALGIILALFV